MDGIAQTIINNSDVFWLFIAQQGALLFRFFQNSFGSSISDLLYGIVQNSASNILILQDDNVIFACVTC